MRNLLTGNNTILIAITIIILITYYQSIIPIYGKNQQNDTSSYNFNNPEIVISLPDKLKEISDIAYLGNDTIACVQDEDGIIFIYDINKRLLVQQYSFGDEGDYEGITIAGKIVYVLRSDGVLFEIVNFRQKNSITNKYSLNIPVSNNEGLCYDKQNNGLLITAKSKPEKSNEGSKFERYIYCFNLNTKSLNKEPLFGVYLPELQNFVYSNNIQIPPKIKKDGEIKERTVKFRPSAIAIHPITNEIYVLSAVEYLLYIFNTSGEIIKIIVLNPEVFIKSESLCFRENGDIIIGNEGEENASTILLFKYNQ
ncbi:MAG: hypothetical protein JXB17_10170 [Bacteroidales bacterium]|nr:hypothetical protein [Bacteroidales bacterium]